ncbi:MAG: AAA family ATPase [Clostridiales bacterium]|nr:AAA family ATPase [Clostridiales bacterium]
MDKKDQIILQQLEVIRSMTEHNMRRMADDFWGTPLTSTGDKPSCFNDSHKKGTAKDGPMGKDADPSEPLEKAKNTPQSEENKPSAPLNGQPASPAPEADSAEEPPEDIEDLKAELETYIGLGAIKKEVSNLINMVTVHQLRKQNDLPVVDLSLHMVFSGNPGTGKTMIARLMARIYKSLGVLSKGQLVEVDRSGLVAGYVGQTAIKTAEVIEKAKGGLLFIDEAYALSNKAENDFGQEAIDTLLKAMEDNRDDLVIIVAGYDGLMDDFIHSNPGLESRFNRYLHFDDYTVEEMTQIFELQCKKGCYEMSPEVRASVKEFITEENTNSISFGNARGVRNLFEQILVNQANRLAALETVTREDLMKITMEDVEISREEARKNWSPAARDAYDRGGSGAKKPADTTGQPDSLSGAQNAADHPEVQNAAGQLETADLSALESSTASLETSTSEAKSMLETMLEELGKSTR